MQHVAVGDERQESILLPDPPQLYRDRAMDHDTNKRMTTWLGLSAMAHALVVAAWLQAPHTDTAPVSLASPISVEVVAEYRKPVRATTQQAPVTNTEADDMVAANNASSPRPTAQVTHALSEAASAPGDADRSYHLTELQSLLLSAINRSKRYPATALRLQQQGTTRIGFRLRQDGRIDTPAILTSSGHRLLDQAALSTIDRIQPFLPARQLVKESQDLQVDIIFRL